MNCHKCHKTIPDESLYCLYCGVFLKVPEVEEAAEVDLDWENRVLCSDGTCIGTITDGKCTVCGAPYAGNAGS